MTKIKRFKDMNEGKAEDAKIDELLDKGEENLTQKEKELLQRLSAGGKLEEEKPKVKRNYGGEDPRDFLNKILGTNIGKDTQITQIMPDDTPFPPPREYRDDQEGIGHVYIPGPDPFKKSTTKQNFKEGDIVIYIGRTEGYRGKKATFGRVKEDGKFSITFEGGKKLVVNPKNIIPHKKDLDPYNEENWEEEIPKRTGGKKEFNHPNNVPGDFYFHVGNFNDEGIAVTLTYIDFFNEHGCVADDLGSYNLSQNVINALNNAGVYGDAEIMEAVWEARRDFTVEQIRQNMIQAGFVQNNEFDNFLNGL